jgi:hypothetical protein
MTVELAYPGTRKIVTFTIKQGDPDEVVVRIKPPPGAGPHLRYTYGVDDEVQRTGAGIYPVTVVCPRAGLWVARIEVDGSLEGAYEQSWKIEPSAFPAAA